MNNFLTAYNALVLSSRVTKQNAHTDSIKSNLEIVEEAIRESILVGEYEAQVYLLEMHPSAEDVMFKMLESLGYVVSRHKVFVLGAGDSREFSLTVEWGQEQW